MTCLADMILKVSQSSLIHNFQTRQHRHHQMLGCFEISDVLLLIENVKVKAILSDYITSPTRTPDGTCSIIAAQLFAESVEIVHQTRTGILTGSDQRVRTRVYDRVYTVEDSPLMGTSW